MFFCRLTEIEDNENTNLFQHPASILQTLSNCLTPLSAFTAHRLSPQRRQPWCLDCVCGGFPMSE